MSQSKDRGFISELFKDNESAEKAYKRTLKLGYKSIDINLIISEESKNKYYDSIFIKERSAVASSGTLGAAVLGLAAGVAAMKTDLIIPDMGLIIAGPLATGLASVGLGSFNGGLAEILVGWGISEDQAKIYEIGIKSGGIVLGVDDYLPHSTLHAAWKKYHSRRPSLI
ncbi:MAG: hypothetical protein H0U75_02415 [Legionella sp.]|nr:hypothetical protein [Legionella sp.]